MFGGSGLFDGKVTQGQFWIDRLTFSKMYYKDVNISKLNSQGRGRGRVAPSRIGLVEKEDIFENFIVFIRMSLKSIIISKGLVNSWSW